MFSRDISIDVPNDILSSIQLPDYSAPFEVRLTKISLNLFANTKIVEWWVIQMLRFVYLFKELIPGARVCLNKCQRKFILLIWNSICQPNDLERIKGDCLILLTSIWSRNLCVVRSRSGFFCKINNSSLTRLCLKKITTSSEEVQQTKSCL